MNTLVCVAPGQFEYRQASVPKVKPGEALIKIKKVGICGTDLHAFEGTQPYFDYPRILGHEIAAEFIEGDGGFLHGELVTIIPYFNCGKCHACVIGKPNCCVDLKVCGVHQDGAMSEYITVRYDSLIQANGLSSDELVLVEPLAIGVHSVQRAGIKKDDVVLVIGAGPIGLGIMEFAHLAEAKVIAMDINDSRLEFCRKNLICHGSVNPRSTDAVAALKEITNGNMPDVIFDATGNLSAINNSFNLMSHGGRYILVGLQKENITFSHPFFHKREGTLMSSRNALKSDFMNVIAAIRTGKINVRKFVSNRVEFSQVKKEFPSYLRSQSSIIKTVIDL